MTYQQIVDQVKEEGRIDGDNDLVPIVIGLINEAYKEAVMDQRPFELRKNATINLTASNSEFNLPADFFIHHQFIFHDVDTGKEWKLVDQDGPIQPAPRGFFNHPKSFELISGNKVQLKPFEGIITSDTLKLEYYYTPPILTLANLSTPNPIVRLEPFIVRMAIRRVRMFHLDDPTVMEALSGDVNAASQAFQRDKPTEPPTPKPS